MDADGYGMRCMQPSTLYGERSEDCSVILHPASGAPYPAWGAPLALRQSGVLLSAGEYLYTLYYPQVYGKQMGMVQAACNLVHYMDTGLKAVQLYYIQSGVLLSAGEYINLSLYIIPRYMGSGWVWSELYATKHIVWREIWRLFVSQYMETNTLSGQQGCYGKLPFKFILCFTLQLLCCTACSDVRFPQTMEQNKKALKRQSWHKIWASDQYLPISL